MYTNTTRITGLSGSGIDTDTMVKQLMQAESAKLYRYQRNVTWKTWQQESYRNVISKFQTFQDKWLGTSSTSLRFSKAFQNFKNEVKNSKGVSSDAVTINSSTASVKYEMSVQQLAQNDTYSGSATVNQKMEGTADVSGIAQKLANGEEISLVFNVDGKSKTITLTKEEFDDFHWIAGDKDDIGSPIVQVDDTKALEALLNDKLEKAFGRENLYETDADGNKVPVYERNDDNSVKMDADGNPIIKSVVKAKVSFTDNGDGSATFKAETNLGHSLSVASEGVSSESTRKMSAPSGDQSGEFMVSVDGKNYMVVVDSSKMDDTLTFSQKINHALKTAVGADGDKDLTSLLSVSEDESGNVIFSSKSATSDIQIINNGSNKLTGLDEEFTLKSTSDLKNYFGIKNGSTNTIKTNTTLENIFGSDVWDNATQSSDGKYTFNINGEKIEFSKYDTLATFMAAVNNSGADVKLSYNSTNAKFTFESKDSGAVNTITFGSDNGTKAVMSALGFEYGADGKIAESQHTKTAQDAVLTIDGVTTTRTTNTFDLDGMNITLNKKTEPGETLTLGNERDSEATFDMIKSFVEEYNTLIGELNTSVKETRAKSDDYTYYEPLTDAEKKEMTEDEVKLWEEKAKTGLLYRDSTITSILSKMRSIMYSSVQLEDGSKIALYELGITTSSNYTDNGKLVIDEDKLKTAIQERGDDIQSLFTGTTKSKGLADMLNDTVETAIGTKGSLREKAGIVGTASANENTLSKEIKELNEKITAEKKRLVEKETKYYNMFSSMESSIMSSNSQLDAMFSMLGQ